MKKTVGYLGPQGTFTEEALFTQSDLTECELIEFPTITDIIESVDHSEIDYGFVPIENAIEGSVLETLDQLVFVANVFIRREIVIDIHLHLLGPHGTKLSQIKKIYSYPHAWAQCRGWIRSKLSEVEICATTSTAEAARIVSINNDGVSAAVAPKLSAKLYNLDVIASEIEDHSENQTRFVLLSSRGIPRPTGHDKTSIVCFQYQDKPGSLHSILGEFAARGINLTKLESRPSRQGLGQYCFLIDLEGHLSNPVVSDCLKTLKAELADIKFLGSYPVFGEKSKPEETHISDRWKQAQSWLDDLTLSIEDN